MNRGSQERAIGQNSAEGMEDFNSGEYQNFGETPAGGILRQTQYQTIPIGKINFPMPKAPISKDHDGSNLEIRSQETRRQFQLGEKNMGKVTQNSQCNDTIDDQGDIQASKNPSFDDHECIKERKGNPGQAILAVVYSQVNVNQAEQSQPNKKSCGNVNFAKYPLDYHKAYPIQVIKF